ncbi:lipase maturation factor 1 isoform X2 [Meles meles]|uniref:lipase maturation factor 1 isoform X2 n=1 Tax=Meles meles TaxID=9662 RepID=UPI001E69DF21|nr:lipase maturation factor 1 isoform X2 [Meles meles]
MRSCGPAMAAPEESLRRRKVGNAGAEPGSPPGRGPGRDPTGCNARLRAGTFWLTRIVLLRALAFVYFVAFLVAFQQNKQLIGDRGLLPCRTYLKSVQQYFRGPVGWDAVSYAPTVLWLLDWSHMDSNLDTLALLGLGISSFVLLTGCANMVLMATLWVLYMSLVNVGQIWYSFGREAQLLETGFLGVFLCPLWSLSRLPTGTPPSRIVLWGFRWLIFRIMLGATQPVPNPVAYFLHWSPWWVHRFQTLSNHFLELVVPFFLFLGRRMRTLHGALQILFQRLLGHARPPGPGFLPPPILSSGALLLGSQVVLVISGNLSFLNWLTMVPSVACFDDATLGFLFPSGPGGLKDRVLKLQEAAARGLRPPPRCSCMVRRAVHVALGVLVAWLSVPVVVNLLSPTQVMNTSFNPLRIVNTYGAFGSITKERTEVILQGTASLNASTPDAVWEDYEFKCKPGDPGRRPCLISPYHYRLDWLMWFAAFQTYEQHEWVLHLAGRLLANDASALSLLALNPFENRAPPRWVRGEHYRYKFSRPGGRHAAAGNWWVRKRLGPYFPPVTLAELKDYFQAREWPYPELP